LYNKHAAESEAGDEDAKRELESDLREMVRNTLNLTLIDEVFHAWCDQCSELFAPQAMLRYFKHYPRYTHLSIPYLSTIFDIEIDDERWRNIKLCNNGFIYAKVPGTPKTIARHKFDGWNLLNACLPHLQNVEKYLARHCGPQRSVCVFYNYERQRLDIKCYGEVNIIVTFEPGIPYCESDDMFENQNTRSIYKLVRG